MRQRAAVTTVTSVQSGAVLFDAAPSSAVHLTGAVIAASGDNTAVPSVTIKIGSSPVFSHPGVPAGGGLAVSGFDIVGNQGEDVTIDCDDPGGSLSVMVAYWV